MDGVDEFADEAVGAVAHLLPKQALSIAKGAFDRFEELKQGDIFGSQGQCEAAVGPAGRFDDPGTDKLLHDFGQMMSGDLQSRGDFLVDDTTFRLPSQECGRMEGERGGFGDTDQVSHVVASGLIGHIWSGDCLNDRKRGVVRVSSEWLGVARMP